ncbi:MAG: sulfatase-like hydrolase/transferase [Bermanella sp.]
MLQYLKKVWFVNRSVGLMLGLNVALLTLISAGFSDHFPEVSNGLDVYYQIAILPSVWGLYAILFAILALVLSFVPMLRIPLLLLCAFVGGSLAVFVFIDNFIYDIYNYHINWFFIKAFIADEGGEFFDISYKTYFTFSFVAVLVTLTELLFLWLVLKKLAVRSKYRHFGKAFFCSVFLIVVSANLIHSWAYAKNYAPITSIGAHIPLYFPLHSRSIAGNALLNNFADTAGENSKMKSNIYYPKQNMVCDNNGEQLNVVMVVLESWRGDMFDAEIMPFTHQLASESQWFKEHYSSGSVTTKGIFALMYGLVPTYMENIVANNGAGGPVLLNEMIKRDYKFGVYPSGDIFRMKLADSSFLPVRKFIDHGKGKDTIEKDYDVLSKMNALVEGTEDPYYGFMFFNSSHHQYYYPDNFKKFTPAKNPSLIDFKQGKNPEPYLNHYKNSLFFIDSLIENLVSTIKAKGQWDNTILIITSDHGEEFGDTQPTRFGHGSNFTRYQTHVPFVMHWPGKEPKSFDHRTASIDVAPTILQEAFNCTNPMDEYSNGDNLFNEQSRNVQVMASYYNYAFVTKDGGFIQNPIGLVESRDNMDKSDSNVTLDPKAALSALQQMKSFYSKPAQ